MKESEFNQCLEIYRNGEEYGLEKIYHEYYKRCMITALPIVRNNRILAEDVASITLINIMEYATRHDDNVNNPNAWVYEIAKNAAYRLMAKENVYNAEFSEELVPDPSSFDSDFWMDFYRVIAPLSEKQKEYAELHYIFELKYREIAGKFSVSEAAVKQSFQHIKEHLKKYFKNQ